MRGEASVLDSCDCSAASSRVQLDALGVAGVEREVQPQDRHVHEYDTREQNPADRDPEDAAAGTGASPDP